MASGTSHTDYLRQHDESVYWGFLVGYGLLPTAPRMFHNLLHNWFIADGFTVNPHEPCLYVKWIDRVPLFALTHVDDVTIISTKEFIADMLARIEKVFAIKRLGALGLNSDGQLCFSVWR